MGRGRLQTYLIKRWKNWYFRSFTCAAGRAAEATEFCWPAGAIPVVLGRAGILANKREGDGATAALIEALAKRNDCRCLSIINKITLAIRPAFGNSTSLKEMNLAREF